MNKSKHYSKRAIVEYDEKHFFGKIRPDPMFYLNHACARLWADLCRMRRRTWATSKSIEKLEAHLWCYVAWSHGYGM